MLHAYAALGLTFSAIVLAGCAPEPAPEPTATVSVNETCPIMGGEVTPEGGSVMWNGKMIGFCCDSCIPDWNELSDAEKAEKLAEAMNGSPTSDASDHHREHG